MACFQILQAQSVNIVKNFGYNMHAWVSTDNDIYRTNIVNMCDGRKKARVCDEIAQKLAIQNNIYSNISYMLDSYLNWIEKAIDTNMSIEFSNFEEVDNRDIVTGDKKYERYADELKFVSCDIKTKGTVSCSTKDLFYIRDGKISKIAKYEKTGNKIKVDLSDLLDEVQTFGATYNYGKHFPVGASVFYSYSFFMISLDFGINKEKDSYIVDNVEMTNIMNYKRTKKILDPKCYVTITPSLYLKYVSIGCGVGFLCFTGKEEYASYEDDNSGSIGLSSTQDADGNKFMIRPSVRGFIPFNDECALTLNLGYNYVFGYKDKNGIDIGIGFQYTFDF